MIRGGGAAPWVSEPDSDESKTVPTAAVPSAHQVASMASLAAAADDWPGAVEDDSECAATGLTAKYPPRPPRKAPAAAQANPPAPTRAAVRYRANPPGPSVPAGRPSTAALVLNSATRISSNDFVEAHLRLRPPTTPPGVS